MELAKSGPCTWSLSSSGETKSSPEGLVSSFNRDEDATCRHRVIVALSDSPDKEARDAVFCPGPIERLSVAVLILSLPLCPFYPSSSSPQFSRSLSRWARLAWGTPGQAGCCSVACWNRRDMNKQPDERQRRNESSHKKKWR